ncbi:MAG: hypothetical protein ABI761_20365 [Saprospiraceae bacterium]
MKNKLLNLTMLMVFGLLVFQVPVQAQTEAPAVKSEKKVDKSRQSGKLEERNQSNAEQEGQDKMYDQRRMHRGGKQNFQRREFQGGRFDHPGFRHFQYNNRGNRHNFYGPSFRSRDFRNYGYGGEGFRYRGYDNRGFRGYGRPELRGNDFRARGFNRNQDRAGQFNRKQDPAMKSLRENIWKDGIMDIKERDMLRNKMKEFRSQNPGQFRQRRNDNIPDPKNDKK